MELNDNTLLEKTNYSNHDIHIVDFKNQPNTTLEIGRLRELSFRKIRWRTENHLI